MDFQDQNTAQSVTPTVPALPATPLPTASVPTYSPLHIQTDGDVTAVPQEPIGLEAAEMIPVPAERLVPPAEVFAESSLPVSTSAIPATPEALVPEQVSVVPDVDTPPSTEKTPLEILEEILASANENPSDTEGGAESSPAEEVATEEALQQKAQEEARQQAALAAEEQRYRQEVDQRITLAQQDLQEAADQREEVTQQLQAQGKQVGPTVNASFEDTFAIQQLKHDKLDQNGQ